MTKRQKEFEQLMMKVLTESGQLEEMRRRTEAQVEQAARQTKLETATNIDFICRHTSLTAEQVRAL